MSVLGYSHFDCPSDGIGFLSQIFDSGLNLQFQDNLNAVDAIVLWGGSDISPSLYNETPIANSGPLQPSVRDLYEWHLIKEAVAAKKPIIGICRGAQLLCAYAGGKLVQHVTGHMADHEIICQDHEFFIANSCHHQMMFPFDIEHTILAWTTEKKSHMYLPIDPALVKVEPEVVYFPKINGFAIQGHPEWLNENCSFVQWCIDEFLEQCFN